MCSLKSSLRLQVARLGSGLAILDLLHVGSALSLRSFGRVGSALAVLDFLHLGSSLALRSYSRCGTEPRSPPSLDLMGGGRNSV